MPILKTVNQDFFKKWNPEMAYVLGFFAADGNMIKNNRGAHFIAFYSTDFSIIKNVRNLMASNHKISSKHRSEENLKWKDSYQLQIGSKEIFKDLLHLGLMPNKSLVLKMPRVPDKFLNHFVRGYFDGDGHVSAGVYHRKNRRTKANIITTGFTSGGKVFLKELLGRLQNCGIVFGGSLYENKGYRLCFSIRDSFKLYNFMYKNDDNLCLERKKSIFRHYFSNLLGT